MFMRISSMLMLYTVSLWTFVLPSDTRNLTLETKGGGKAKVDIRVVAKKRQRSRRGLTQDDYYPVRLTVHQERVSKGTIRQTVCLRVLSPLVTAVQLTHGLFTGYTTTPSSVAILANSTSLSFFSLPALSASAVHFVLGGFRPNEMLCYAVGVTEPQHSHEPLHLAPVAITARHPAHDVVGQVLISHPDQASRNRRSKRNIGQKREPPHEVLISRYPRDIVDETIDTVCFEGGQCSCAESTCGVKCGLCARDNGPDLRAFISKPQNFGAFVRVHSVDRALIGSAFYTHISTEVREKRGGAEHHISEKLDVWLRECNPRCTSPAVNDNFFILGEYGALSVDSLGRQHYVLRNLDRFEKATEACSALANVIVLG
ncbi:hypothetical protein OESDEN_03916 [Oesophagostomum dentatum]|uniref:Uncharacterized protein n=1 Tax=Oesophagostomum dentatum TaxID=61180 RepID=A0A0B1TK25_OESDE|nr:hypothetical protein OESDEN_03916 [Oesophagostomum dentatum]